MRPRGLRNGPSTEPAASWSAARRAVYAIGTGVLGAALCAAFVYAAGHGHDPDDQLSDPGKIDRSQRALTAAEQPAMRLLQRAVLAGRQVWYAGTQVITSDGQDVFVDVWHQPGKGTTSRVDEGVLDPSSTDAQLIDDTIDDGLDDLVLATLTHGYTLSTKPGQQCNGGSATVVMARDRRTGVLAAKLWVDEATGLLLQRKMFTSAGTLLRSTSYTEIKIGAEAAADPGFGHPPAPDGSIQPQGGTRPAASSSPDPAAKPRELTDSQVAALRARGWPLPEVLPGGMQRYRAYEMQSGGATVIQLSFSDGLFSSSLFVQRGQLDTRHLRGVRPVTVGDATVYASTGLYRTLVWAGGDTVYTLVSDAPASVAESAVTALPHRAPDTSVLGRIGRGLARVASWMNPFD